MEFLAFLYVLFDDFNCIMVVIMFITIWLLVSLTAEPKWNIQHYPTHAQCVKARDYFAGQHWQCVGVKVQKDRTDATLLFNRYI
jgi:hypothetical protein